jgi:hypothetical protein
MKRQEVGENCIICFITCTLILFILVCHTSKLNYRIIVNTVQCDSVYRYLLPYEDDQLTETCKGNKFL